LDPRLHPEAAAAFVDKIDLKTNLFNQHEFGSYLAWRWDGRRKLFYHGFVDDLDFYAKNYIVINESAEQFDRIVNHFNIGAFMLRRMNITPDLPLYYNLYTRRSDWTLVYVDDRSMIFLRNIPENQAALAQCAPLN
jgi:hypothetical protein